MRFITAAVFASVVLGVKADNCPAIWNQVSNALTPSFFANGQCTDLARAAIRYAFHDAGTTSKFACNGTPYCGGSDGSLFWVASEIQRGENGGLQDYHGFIHDFYNGKNNNLGLSKIVGAADLIYFAGNVAVVLCPGGPVVKTVVGRRDEKVVASPTGIMPPGSGPGSDAASLLKLFADKGFTAEDLAALIGAHTTSRAFAQPDIPSGNHQDTTPGQWDVLYYSETLVPPTNDTQFSRFQSDINLSRDTGDFGKSFKGFVNNQGKWNGKFADAMFRLSVLGAPASDVKKFVDCTNALPKPSKRSFIDMPRNNRAR